jgi:hypothetical protein
MTNNLSVICNSRAAAVAALETIASVFPRGMEKDALHAVVNWIIKNTPKDFDEETRARLQKIYDDNFDEAARKAIKWDVEGGEPEHGTRYEVPFLYNADTKQWELERDMPPTWKEPSADILEQEEYIEYGETDR